MGAEAPGACPWLDCGREAVDCDDPASGGDFGRSGDETVLVVEGLRCCFGDDGCDMDEQLEVLPSLRGPTGGTRSRGRRMTVSHGQAMAGDSEWIVEDSEDEGALILSGPNVETPGVFAFERPALRLKTSAAVPSRPQTPERARQSLDISNASLFTPPGESHDFISPVRTADVPSKPKPRPKPRVKKKPSDNPDESIHASMSDAPWTPHISQPSTVRGTAATRDSIQTATTTFPDFSPIDADVYSLDIAERAKMRSRKSKATRKPPADNIIELTSDEDELVLKPAKRPKKQPKPKPRPRPKAKPKVIELSSPDSQYNGVTSAGAPIDNTGSSSQAPVSTAPTNPPTTPLRPQDTPPSPLLGVNVRKRKVPVPSSEDEENSHASPLQNRALETTSDKVSPNSEQNATPASSVSAQPCHN